MQNGWGASFNIDLGSYGVALSGDTAGGSSGTILQARVGFRPSRTVRFTVRALRAEDNAPFIAAAHAGTDGILMLTDWVSQQASIVYLDGVSWSLD